MPLPCTTGYCNQVMVSIEKSQMQNFTKEPRRAKVGAMPPTLDRRSDFFQIRLIGFRKIFPLCPTNDVD